MASPRWRTVLRSLLRQVKEGLIWSGALWSGVPPMYVPMHLDAPLSEAERAAWVALVERLR